MLYVITYDIVDNRTRTRFHKFLKEMGINAQKSVFECQLDNKEVGEIRRYCRKELDLNEDSVRIYHVCSRCYAKAIIQGQGISLPNLDWQII